MLCRPDSFIYGLWHAQRPRDTKLGIQKLSPYLGIKIITVITIIEELYSTHDSREYEAVAREAVDLYHRSLAEPVDIDESHHKRLP